MRNTASDIDDVIHPLHKAIVLVRALEESSIAPALALAGSGLREQDLLDHGKRMSTRQLLQIFHNASQQASDPLFAMKAGLRVHASHLGAFGFALVSSATYRDALHCVRHFRFLSAPLTGRDFQEDASSGHGVFSYRDMLGLDERLFCFVLDFQIGCTRTLATDILGDGFRFLRARLRRQRDEAAGEREALLGATIDYGSDADQLIFDGRWLDCPLPYGHSPTSTALQQVCAQMMDELAQPGEVAAQVSALLVERDGYFPGIEEVAARLHTTSRTLRRKLQAEGTSFAEILASVRKDLAIRYLQSSEMKTESIAASLGFSDVANFRQAFRRWTNMNPSEFRRHGRKPGNTMTGR